MLVSGFLRKDQVEICKNIGTKLKEGMPLDEYEHHIMVDVLLLHARLGS
ncbi:Uncharacterised protein [Legionella maceachernii]|nr:hypothetical protein SAMN02745128_02928 [Legionella maceachernii]SUP01838.1 Uncharacterised protein [Legionella maceachernii]